MKTKYFLTAVFFGTCVLRGFCQYGDAFVMPSHNSTSLIEAVNTPVNLYTGTVNISVPFHTLEGRKTNVPVSISYNSRGIKVDDAVSEVGAGWRMVAGGRITRVVRGRPDEAGYCSISSQDGRRILNGEVARFHQHIIDNSLDAEPDLFFYEFPGRSGKFVLDEDGEAFTIPYENMIITPAIGIQGEGEWTIVDENGMKYTFGEAGSDDFHEVTASELYSGGKRTNDGFKNMNSPTRSPYSLEYISTWHLRKIESPDGRVEFTFDYLRGEEIVDFDISFTEIDVFNADCNGIHDRSAIQIKRENTVSEPKYLSKINGPIGYVEFQYSPQRLDLPNGLKLEGIVVKDFREEDVERYVFNHRYFNSSVLTHSCLNAFCQKSENTYRLCLQDIYKIGSDQSQLLYRKFIYDEREDYLIPPRFSIHKDHWGYGNNPSAHDASHFYFDVPEITFDDGLVLGGDRKNVGAGSLSLLLKKMIIETKGSVHYDYEQNLTGGGRIRTITINDNENEENNVVKTYTYEDPSNIVEPVYHYRYNQYYLNAIYPLSIYGIPITLRDDCNLDIIIRTSKSMKALYDIDGISVGYGRVRETLGDGSFTEYEFTNSEDRPNENPYVYTGVVPFSNAWSGISDKTERTDYHSPPFFPHTYKGWERGLLKGKKIFDSGGHLKHETINQYYFEMNDRKVIKGYSVVSYATDENGDFIIHAGEYDIISRPVRLRETIERTYEKNTGEYFETQTNFYWNSEALQLQKVEKTLASSSIGRRVKGQKYLYCTDYAQEGFVEKLMQTHQINKPIEIVSYEGSTGTLEEYSIVDGKVNVYTDDMKGELAEVYQLTISQPLPQEDFKFSNSELGSFPEETSLKLSFNRDMRYEKVKELFYDTFGNILRSSDKRGNVVEYEWNAEYHSFYPTAISTSVSDDYFVNTFDYKPMVGIVSEADVNGKIKYYEYDPYNRLKLVKDEEGNILKRVSYQFKVEDTELDVFPKSINFSGSGTQIATFEIMTEGEWEIEISNPFFWLSEESGNGNATITLTTLNIGGAGAPLYSNITVNTENESEVVSVNYKEGN